MPTQILSGIVLALCVLTSTIGCNPIAANETSPIHMYNVTIDTLQYMGSTLDDPDLDVYSDVEGPYNGNSGYWVSYYAFPDFGETFQMPAGQMNVTFFEYASADSIMNRRLKIQLVSDTTIYVERIY